jgi:AraC-like DNA-binding protein
VPVIADIQHDSPLGRWRMVRWAPGLHLTQWVRALWDLESRDAYTRERILPRTHFDLLINLGDPHRLYRGDDGAPVAFRRAWVSGLQQRFLDVESPRSSRLIGAELTPAGARVLLRTPLGAIADRVVELDEILGRDVERLRERLADQATAAHRLQMLESWIGRRTADTATPPAAVVRATSRIVRTSGGSRIGDLAREAGVSHKHLIALFDDHVGFTPKQFARILRFNALVACLESNRAADWGDIVHRFGYYDHPHFARELRQFAGTSPTDFLRSLGPEGNSVVVG